MRLPGTGVLSFGLVAIPVRLHTATKSENVSFHLLHEKCGSRVRNQYHCPVCNIVVERDALVRGFQHAMDHTCQSLKKNSEASRPKPTGASILKSSSRLLQWIRYVSKILTISGADKGGEKPYRLLVDAMAKSGRVAIAELVSRGKEQLVLIRPYRKGLVLHTMYYGDEVRDFKQVPKGENVKVQKRK